jgi:hypothetical protein
LLEKDRGAPRCFGFLILVVESGADRVMGVVDLGGEVGERKLQGVTPQPIRLARRRQTQARFEKGQDIGDMRDLDLGRTQIGRSEGRARIGTRSPGPG